MQEDALFCPSVLPLLPLELLHKLATKTSNMIRKSNCRRTHAAGWPPASQAVHTAAHSRLCRFQLDENCRPCSRERHHEAVNLIFMPASQWPGSGQANLYGHG